MTDAGGFSLSAKFSPDVAAYVINALLIKNVFFFLAKKPSNQYQLVVNCAEFYVFLVLLIASVILLGVGGGLVFAGIARKKANERLLQEINDRTFVQ